MEKMCISIINSNSPWFETYHDIKDALLEKNFIIWFLKRWGFPVELSEDKHILESLAGLRSLLSTAIDTVMAGKEIPDDILAKMNRYLSDSAIHYEIKAKDRKYQLSLTPKKVDLNYILSEITVSFVQMINESDISRFKRCENPDCRSVFHDSSKNQTRKWCCNSCSSLIKVRRHREKKKNNTD